jgi:hypothetical protein
MAIDVFVGDRVVAVHLTGVDSVWSLRSRLLVPIDDIVSARVVDRDDALGRIGWKLGGTSIPGVVAAGTFGINGNDGDRAFCCTYRDEEFLEIETKLPRPRLILLQHPDRHELAWLIGERVH